MYQFLTTVRVGPAAANLRNRAGQATSHLQGFLSRMARLLEAGVMPVFVFDGKPPELKAAVNQQRREARAAAADQHAAIVTSTPRDEERIYKVARRATSVGPTESGRLRTLLQLAGAPV